MGRRVPAERHPGATRFVEFEVGAIPTTVLLLSAVEAPEACTSARCDDWSDPYIAGFELNGNPGLQCAPGHVLDVVFR
ncbi:hypothetical protein ACVLV4_001922 [Rathayibacter agropyri]